jgi:diacylglycerol kinase (ATP)
LLTQISRPRLAWSATRCLVVVNPAAAGVTRDLVAEVMARAAARAGQVEVISTSAPDLATEAAADAARSRTVEMIVVVGGDGTASRLAAGVLSVDEPKFSPALLVLPGGSGNSTSINVWGDRNYSQVLDAVLRGPGWSRWSVDVQHLVEPDVYSILGTSTGLLAQALIDAGLISDKRGRDRYMDAAAKVLADPPTHPCRVTVDGSVVCEIPVTVVAVGGGRIRVSAFEFLPLSDLSDGLLDVCAIAASRPQVAEEIVGRLLDGSHLAHPAVRYAQGRQVVIERTDGGRLVAEYDGEVLRSVSGRLTVEVKPAALDLVVPSTLPYP